MTIRQKHPNTHKNTLDDLAAKPPFKGFPVVHRVLPGMYNNTSSPYYEQVVKVLQKAGIEIKPRGIANNIVSVQPMTLPSGTLFYLDYQYGGKDDKIEEEKDNTNAVCSHDSSNGQESSNREGQQVASLGSPRRSEEVQGAYDREGCCYGQEDLREHRKAIAQEIEPSSEHNNDSSTGSVGGT